jgi:hypothetical protein
MSKITHPTPELVQDLQQVFDKHNWSGEPIGFAQPKASIGGAAAAEDDPGDCPVGTTPQTVTYSLPNGQQVTKTICV